MSSGIPKLGLWLLAITIFASSFATAQSGNGRLTGKVSSVDGKPMAGVVVIATNQTTADSEKQQTKADGSYSIRLRQERIEYPSQRPMMHGLIAARLPNMVFFQISFVTPQRNAERSKT